LPAVNGNGASRRWRVEREPGFVADQQRLEAQHPRLGRVFAAVERQFEAIPSYRAHPLDARRFLYLTRSAWEAPAMVLFYEIRAEDRVVLLIGVDLNR